MDKLQWPTVEHHKYIFVHTTKRRPQQCYTFDGCEINKCLKEGKNQGYNYYFEAGPLRHIFTAIADHHFPGLKRPSQSSGSSTEATPIAEQGQHSLAVKERHYAGDEIAQATGLPLGPREQQFAVSHTIQAWMGLVPANYELSQLIDSRPAMEADENKLCALDMARQLVLTHYKIGNMNADERKQWVKTLMDSVPFLRGNQVSISNADVLPVFLMF
jgi:hypothetical protein